MKYVYPHRLWLILAIAALAVMAGSAPLLHLARARAAHNLVTVESARVKTEHDLRQLRDDVAAARKLATQIDRAKAEQVLAPADRLQAAAMLENEAARARLAHFAYTLAPEERVSIDAGGEAQELAVSAITLAADAPDDASVYSLVARVLQELPGRARVLQLTVTRNGDLNVPLAAVNVHFEAALEWLSNGSMQTVAGSQ